MTRTQVDAVSGAGILIVGGYGHVGSRIARRLLAAGIAPVRLAGRDRAKAVEMADRLGCEAVGIDVRARRTWDEALRGIACVVVCVDQTDTGFVESVLERGLVYVDITAEDAFFRDVERLDGLARSKGGRAILSVGLAPGLTNLLVKACAAGMDRVDSARIGILLGIGDEHGPAAIDWTLANFRKARGGRTEQIPFGQPPREHPAIPFDFADQHVVRRTLGIPGARTFLTFDTPVLSRMMFGVLRLAAVSPVLSRALKRLMPRFRAGSDRTALSVEVRGTMNGRRIAHAMKLEGRKEAAITASVAALVVEHVLLAEVPAGVHHIEQLLSIGSLVPGLGKDVVISEVAVVVSG